MVAMHHSYKAGVEIQTAALQPTCAHISTQTDLPRIKTVVQTLGLHGALLSRSSSST